MSPNLSRHLAFLFPHREVQTRLNNQRGVFASSVALFHFLSQINSLIDWWRLLYGGSLSKFMPISLKFPFIEFKIGEWGDPLIQLLFIQFLTSPPKRKLPCRFQVEKLKTQNRRGILQSGGEVLLLLEMSKAFCFREVSFGWVWKEMIIHWIITWGMWNPIPRFRCMGISVKWVHVSFKQSLIWLHSPNAS